MSKKDVTSISIGAGGKVVEFPSIKSFGKAMDKAGKEAAKSPHMRPVDLAAIAQGGLALDLDNELALIETQFTTFIAEHKDAAHKAKARVVLAITFEYDAEQPSYMGITGRITSVLPRRPGRACLGRIDRARRRIVCLPSGAGMDSPDQGQLCTQDGRAIDTETGEVAEG